MSEFQKAAELLNGQNVEDLTDSDFDCLQRCVTSLRESGLVSRISERVIRKHRKIGACDIEHALNTIGQLAIGPSVETDGHRDHADERDKPSLTEVAAIIFQQAALISPAL